MKKLKPLFIFILSFTYMEFLYRILLYKNVFNVSNIIMILFVVFIATLLYFLSTLFKEKVNKRIFYVIFTLVTLWFSAQYVVKGFFDFYISFSILQIADQVGDFMGKAVMEILRRTPGILLFFMPLIITIIFNKKIKVEKVSIKENFSLLLGAMCIFGIYLVSLDIQKTKAYSPYELFYEVNNPALSVEKMGVLNTFFLDTHRAIWGFEDKINIQKKTITKEKTVKKNVLEFDFEKIKEESKDDKIKQMTEYFQNEEGTNQNEYTKYFKGKNLILFMAESFNEIAVTKETTPTLYKMVNNGFVFNNYYTPTVYSTIGGEFQELTGLYANFSALSTFRRGSATFPMGIATMFKEAGYNTYAYHDNSYAFQNRDTYLKTQGFTNFKACGTGLEKSINCEQWPQSDVEMINTTVDDYINSEEPFMVFYASVSGHSSYTWTNAMSKKHREEIEKLNLGYSDPVLAYMAAQMEFDRALNALVTKLEEAGKLDDTVIIFAGDHYPYELTVDQVNEAATYEKDDVIEINHSNLAIYNSKMKKVSVEKVGSTIDIIPTIYNLFGLNYDSRLIIGKDLLSDGEGLAMFSNNSWITDTGRYYAATEQFVPTKDNVDESYTKNKNIEVQNKIIMSKYIIEKDYYKLLWNNKIEKK